MGPHHKALSTISNYLEIYTYNEINRFIDRIPLYIKKLEDAWRSVVQAWDALLGKFTTNYFVIMHSEQILIGLLVLATAGIVLGVMYYRKSSQGRRKLTTKPVNPSQAKKAAKRSAKMGDFIRAGEYYEQAKRFDKAIQSYLKGKNPTMAAKVYAEKMGQPEKGLELLHSYQLHASAAEMYASLGQYDEAGEYFLKAGKQQMAAEALERAGRFEKAGQLYQRSDRIAEAARCYSRAKAWGPAGEMYASLYKHYRQSLGERAGREESAKLQNLAKQAGYHLRQAGQVKRAGELLLDANLSSYAAEMLAEAGESERAADLFLEQGEYKKAAEILYKAGDKRRAAEIMARWHQAEARPDQALKYLELAEDYLSAADIYAGKGDYEKAAEMYLKGGDSKTASEMFIVAGKPDRGIRIFEEQGDMESAIRVCEETGNQQLMAELYERSKRPHKAAEAYLELGQTDKAASLLEKVPQDNPAFADARYNLGQILMQRGDYENALEKLQEMATRLALAPATLDHYYLLARAYEGAEHYMYAMGVYQQIAQFNYNYKDTVMRFNALAQKVQQQAASKGSAWGKPGGTVGQRYKVEKEIGRGGMGVVYLAQDMHLDRRVAFKVLAEELKADQQMVENFIREAKSLAKLSHPYIVSIFDAGEEGGVYFIIMEYVRGKDFKQLKGENKRLPLAAGIKVFSQVAQALSYAHDLKIIHRDIKPANIMWTQTQIIKIMDFGLAKVVDQMREGKTQIAGTPYYMSPEQTMGKEADFRSDIYSMGVTVYELLTGTVPFKQGDIGYHHLHTPPTPPRELNPQVPEEVQRILLKCMAKDPAHRYQSAGQVYDEIVRSYGQGGS